MQVSVNKGDSHIWKRMIAARGLVNSNTLWEINSGNISARWENWADFGNVDFPEDIEDKKVSNFIQDGRWDLSKIESWFPNFPESSLNQRNLDPQPDQDDKMLWKNEPSGLFSLKSAYESIRKRNPKTFSEQQIWHSNLPLKISVFVSNL